MKTLLKLLLLGLIIVGTATWAQAPEQSTAPADRVVSQSVSSALVRVGIDPRVTSVKVVTTAGHVVYLTGLISDRSKIMLAGATAAKAAPGYRIVNNIHAGFFDDPNHVNGSMTK